MLVDDALKNTVRHHLANWKTLRGVTPFYSKMCWPDPENQVVTQSETSEKFTDFPSVLIQLDEMFTEEELKQAQEEFPHLKTVMSALTDLCRYAKSSREPLDKFRPTSDGLVTFDLLKKAYELEDATATYPWTPLQIARFALKVKEFSEALIGEISIQISRGATFGFKNGKITRHGNANYLRRGRLRAALGEVAKHALPALSIQKEHDLAVFAADIASQGYDAVYVYDAAGNGHCATGLEQIRSIRGMNKHLGSSLPFKTMETIQGTKGQPTRGKTVIRPFIKAEYGIRVFVVRGEIVAATAQIADTCPGHQVVPFANEVGTRLNEARAGSYQTQFEASLINPTLFGELVKKANAVVTDLKKADEFHYAMDILRDAKGNYAMDIYDLASAEYFALSPSIVANAIHTLAFKDMIPDIELAGKLKIEELTQLVKFSMLAMYVSGCSLTYCAKQSSNVHDDVFGDNAAWIHDIVANTIRIRDLLHTIDNDAQSLLDEDGTWLATHLAISENERKQYDLRGFAAAIRQDFHARFPGNVDAIKNKGDLFHLVPLLDAARWYKGENAQTWRYCASNESDERVTVRPIDSGLSRSEQRARATSFARSAAERYAEGTCGQYDVDDHSREFPNFNIGMAEADEKYTEAAPVKDSLTFDLMGMLLEDDEE